MAGPVFWLMEDSPKVLRFYRDWIAEAPDELMTIVIHRKAPPLDFVPAGAARPARRRRRGLLRRPGRGRRARAQAAASSSGRRCSTCASRSPTSSTSRCSTRPIPHGRWYYMRACDVAELTDEVIDITVEHAMRIRSPRDRVPDLADGRRGGARAATTRPRSRAAAPAIHVQPHQRDRGARGLRRGARSGRATSGRRSRPTTWAST